MARKERVSRDPRAQQLLADDEPLFTLHGMAGHLALSGLTLLLGSVVIWTMKGQWTHWPLTAMAAVGAVMLVLGFIGDREAVLGFLRSRHTSAAANTIVSTGIMFGIVVLLNVISFRHDRKWDWTKGGSNTLDPQTVKIIQRVKDATEIRYYYGGQGGLPRSITKLLDNFQYYSNKLRVKKINAEIDPQAARADGIQMSGQAMVQNMASGRKERPGTVDEQNLASTLLKVMKGGQKNIKFLKGHGEHDPGDSGAGGYDTARKLLEDANHKVDTISLAGKQVEALEGTDLLVIAGPNSDLLDDEAETIREYLLKQQGAALILMEPVDIQLGDLPRPQTPVLYQLVQRFGIEPQKGVLIETRQTLSGILAGAEGGLFFSAPVESSRHESLRPLDRSGDLLVMIALGLRTKSGAGTEAPITTALVESSTQAWCETSQQQITKGEVKADPEDPKGPLSIAVASQITPPAEAKSKKPTKVIVIGDSDFASNDRSAGIHRGGNPRFFQSLVGWLVAEEGESITIVPKTPPPNQVGPFTAPEANKLRLLSFLPGILILTWGISVWWRRR